MTEHLHQATLVAWFRRQYPRDRIFAIPNGGWRDFQTAKKLKLEGVAQGVPDLFIPTPSHGFHGFFIEMKTQKGRASKEQKDWIEFLRLQGYHAIIAKGWDEAKEAIINYMEKELL